MSENAAARSFSDIMQDIRRLIDESAKLKERSFEHDQQVLALEARLRKLRGGVPNEEDAYPISGIIG